MKILLMGAGGQGGPCASILARDPEVDQVILGDIDAETAMQVKDKIGSEKIKVRRIDARDEKQIAEAALGMDVLIDLVTPKFYYQIMQGALLGGIHYVNTAYDRFLWDNNMRLGVKPKLHDAFAEIGKSALLGCGMSSGYTNVIARYYLDQLDTPIHVKVRLAKKDLSIGKYGDAVTPWNPGWDPRQALLDFKLPATIFRNGAYEVKKAPFSEIEEWQFPEPIGKMPVSMHAHEEPYSIPLRFAEKGLVYCDFKYYVNMQIAPVIALGLASEEPVEMCGTKIKPIDLVLSKVPKPSDGFLTEDPTQFEKQDREKHVSLMVEVHGIKNGSEKTYLATIPTMNFPRKEMYEQYGTSLISVALPAVVGAKILAKGTPEKGVIFPHDLDPVRFLKEMEDTGYVHKFYLAEATP